MCVLMYFIHVYFSIALLHHCYIRTIEASRGLGDEGGSAWGAPPGGIGLGAEGEGLRRVQLTPGRGVRGASEGPGGGRGGGGCGLGGGYWYGMVVTGVEGGDRGLGAGVAAFVVDADRFGHGERPLWGGGGMTEGEGGRGAPGCGAGCPGR